MSLDIAHAFGTLINVRRSSKRQRSCFGIDATVRLFGSRTDDRKRGGDTDPLISMSLAEVNAIVRAEIAFQVEVH